MNQRFGRVGIRNAGNRRWLFVCPDGNSPVLFRRTWQGACRFPEATRVASTSLMSESCGFVNKEESYD